MKIKQQWTLTCKGCKQKVTIYEYEGLEGGRYGDHHCKELSDLILAADLEGKEIDFFEEPMP